MLCVSVDGWCTMNMVHGIPGCRSPAGEKQKKAKKPRKPKEVPEKRTNEYGVTVRYAAQPSQAVYQRIQRALPGTHSKLLNVLSASLFGSDLGLHHGKRQPRFCSCATSTLCCDKQLTGDFHGITGADPVVPPVAFSPCCGSQTHMAPHIV